MEPTRNAVRAYMVNEAVTNQECFGNATRLAEEAAHEFDHDEWLDDPNHWLWDVALEVAA